MFLHHGFLAGFQFEDATKGVNPLSHFRRRHFLPAKHAAILPRPTGLGRKKLTTG
jgi:hypothetical protein